MNFYIPGTIVYLPSVYVPKETTHRMENPGKVPLELIEVQVGEYDIVRFEAVYGRVR